MSHSQGLVRFKADGVIKHFEYNGTASCCAAKLYDTSEEMYDNWRKNPPADCVCGGKEPVQIFTNYGGGFYWDGKACRHCNSIEEGLMPYYENKDGEYPNVIDFDDEPLNWVIQYEQERKLLNNE